MPKRKAKKFEFYYPLSAIKLILKYVINLFNPKYRYRLYSNHTKEEAIETIKSLLVRRHKNGKRIFSGKVAGDAFLIKPEFDMEQRYLLRPEIEGKITDGEQTVVDLEFKMDKSIKLLLILAFCVIALIAPFSPVLLKYLEDQNHGYLYHSKPAEEYWFIPLIFILFLFITILMNNYFLKQKVNSSLEILIKEMRTTKKDDLN